MSYEYSDSACLGIQAGVDWFVALEEVGHPFGAFLPGAELRFC